MARVGGMLSHNTRWPRSAAKRRCIGFGIVVLILAFAAVPVQGALTKPQLRDQFKQAYQDINRGRLATLDQLDPGLQHYVLMPYLKFAYLSKHLDKVTQTDIDEFKKKYSSTPLPRQLERRWLKALARQQNWQAFLSAYGGQKDVDLRCHQVSARVRLAPDDSLIGDILKLWLVGHSQHKACDPAFKYLEQAGAITAERRWQRAQLALAEGEVGLARYLSRPLRADRRQLIELWIKTHKAPKSSLAEAANWPDTNIHRDIAAYGLLSYLREDAVATFGRWGQLSDEFSWPEARRNELARRITLFAATDYPDDGLQWLQTLPSAVQDNQIHAWRVRSALHDRNWEAVGQEIQAMPAALQNERRWRYWWARSQEKSGQRDQARSVFADLAGQADYYGFLSADRLVKSYPLCPLNRPTDAQVLAEILRRPEVIRAIELFHVGLLVDARREWHNGVKGLGGQALRQAAVLASQEGWHEKAISALSADSNLRYYSLRFPVDYRKQLEGAAQQHQIDPALLFAIVRAESAYSVDAVSRAGAHGLMQVMPTTARQLAREFGLRYGGKSSLLEAGTNIQYGSLRLNQLMEQFDQLLPAIAAYNAGPNAVNRWVDEGVLDEPDAWIETVPYYETRDYLARVLSFATIYDWRLTGRFRRIEDRMRASPLDEPAAQAAASCPAATEAG